MRSPQRLLLVIHLFFYRFIYGRYSTLLCKRKGRRSSKKYKLKERIETLGSEVKSKVLEKYSDRCITKDLIKSIENDLRKIIFTVRTIYPDFDQFYRESLYA